MKRSHAQNPYQRERLKAGLTQEQAVGRLPFELRSLQAYESGKITPKFDAVLAMAECYGCPINAFAAEEDCEEQEND